MGRVGSPNPRPAWMRPFGFAWTTRCCSPEDVAAGRRLLELAPEGVRENIRAARYRPKQMDPVSVPGGYVLGKNQRITDVLAVEDELLRSEGIDPAWVPFTEAESLST